MSHNTWRYFTGIVIIFSISLMAYSAYLPAKAWLSEKLIAYSWEQALTTNRVSPPWPWADTTAIAKMEVKRLNKSIVLLKGIDPTTLAFSAGVMHQYAFLHQEKPFVVAGHRDTHFSFLENLKQNDILKITDVNNTTKRYQVTNLQIIDSEVTPLTINENNANLTLITCYPFNALRAGGSLRYVVTAIPQTSLQYD